MKQPFGPYSTHILNVSPAEDRPRRWVIPLSFEIIILALTASFCVALFIGKFLWGGSP